MFEKISFWNFLLPDMRVCWRQKWANLSGNVVFQNMCCVSLSHCYWQKLVPASNKYEYWNATTLEALANFHIKFDILNLNYNEFIEVHNHESKQFPIFLAKCEMLSKYLNFSTRYSNPSFVLFALYRLSDCVSNVECQNPLVIKSFP